MAILVLSKRKAKNTTMNKRERLTKDRLYTMAGTMDVIALLDSCSQANEVSDHLYENHKERLGKHTGEHNNQRCDGN